MGTNDRISTSLTCRHGRRQPPCHPGNHGRKTAIRSACPHRSPVGDIRSVLGSGMHSALIEIALRRLFNDGEQCVCSRRYYFLAAMLPSFWRGGTCRWAVSPAARREMETDMNIFGSRGRNETPEFALRDDAPGVFRDRSRPRGRRRARACVPHSELAAGLDCPNDPRRGAWNPLAGRSPIPRRWNSPLRQSGGRRRRSARGNRGEQVIGAGARVRPRAPRGCNRFAVELTAAALLLTSSSIHMPFSAAAV